MATTETRIKVSIQFRRGLESEWIAADPVLNVGEPAYSTDVGRLKVGNGSSKWSELAYIDSGGGGGDVQVDTELSPISVHPVQNQAITKAIQSIEDDLGIVKSRVVYGTTAYWDGQPEFISQENVVYIYTDGFTRDNKNIARFKIGNGQTYLIDLPYMDMVYYDHISNPYIHITQEEREFWNNKVSCYTSGENLVFTTGRI